MVTLGLHASAVVAEGHVLTARIRSRFRDKGAEFGDQLRPGLRQFGQLLVQVGLIVFAGLRFRVIKRLLGATGGFVAQPTKQVQTGDGRLIAEGLRCFLAGLAEKLWLQIKTSDNSAAR